MGQSTDRIFTKLDELIASGDTPAAIRHLEYWIGDAEYSGNISMEITLLNELMGVFRKAGLHDKAIKTAEKALLLSSQKDYEGSELRYTVLLNAGTVYSAAEDFGRAIECYEESEKYFTINPDADQYKKASLLNNMAVAYMSSDIYEKAENCLMDALFIVDSPETYPECAVTYMNLADCYLLWYGRTGGAVRISNCLAEAKKRLDSPYAERNENYYFQCGKCAYGFEMYGDKDYAAELRRRCSERT